MLLRLRSLAGHVAFKRLRVCGHCIAKRTAHIANGAGRLTLGESSMPPSSRDLPTKLSVDHIHTICLPEKSQHRSHSSGLCVISLVGRKEVSVELRLLSHRRSCERHWIYMFKAVREAKAATQVPVYSQNSLLQALCTPCLLLTAQSRINHMGDTSTSDTRNDPPPSSSHPPFVTYSRCQYPSLVCSYHSACK